MSLVRLSSVLRTRISFSSASMHHFNSITSARKSFFRPASLYSRNLEGFYVTLAMFHTIPSRTMQETNKTSDSNGQNINASQTSKHKGEQEQPLSPSSSDKESTPSSSEKKSKQGETDELKSATELEEKDPKVEKIKELEAIISELKTELKYSLAERENVRLRGKKDTENAKQFGIQSFAKDLLPFADNLSLCLASVTEAELKSNNSVRLMYEGVQMTEKEMLRTFKANGLERFEPQLGQKFDPTTMNALSMIEDTSKGVGTICAVLKPGYSLYQRVLRPADVVVVKTPEVQQQQEQQQQQQK